jgi:outer membrane receptor for ferrienterochelin and colicins
VNRRRALFTSSLLAAITVPARARAGGQDLEGLLNETVVTAASSTAETGRNAPATSTVITGESLRKYGVTTLAEALDLLALGTAGGMSTGPTGSELGARGVTIASSNWEHFLLLINGARANGPFFGEANYGPAAMPIEIVDHIEVILGPGSVLYGSNAMLGVIDVVTKDAKDFSGLRFGVESGLFTTVRPWVGYGTTFEIGGQKGEVTAELEYYNQWGPSLYFDPVQGGVDPATGQPYRYTTAPVGTGVWGGGDSTRLTTADSTSLVARARLGKFELSVSGQLSRSPVLASVVDFDTTAVEANRRMLVNLAYANQVSALVALKSHVYLNASDAVTTIDTSWAPECSTPGITCRNELSSEGIDAGVEATPSFDWLRNGTFVTLVGADAAVRSGRSVFNQFDAATGAPVAVSTGIVNRQDGVVAAYAQQTWDPVKWFGVNAGGRLDYDPRFAAVFSPRIAVRVDPWREGTLKVIYSEAFRAPSFFESYFSHPLNPLPVDLRPERVRSIEASIEQRFAAQRVFFGAFATQWTNLISYYNFSTQEAEQYVAEGNALLPPLYQYRNLSTVQNWGYNAAYDGSLAAHVLEYGLNLTAAIARSQTGSGVATPLTVSPRVFGNAHISYRLPGLWPTIALVASAQGARPVENAFVSGFQPIPYVPAQLVLRATLSGEIPGVQGLSYRITGFYSTTSQEPYLAGPDVPPSPQYTSPSLVPIDRGRVIVGVEYRLAP